MHFELMKVINNHVYEFVYLDLSEEEQSFKDKVLEYEQNEYCVEIRNKKNKEVSWVELYVKKQ